MRETRADTVQATLLAIALHVLLFALAWLGMWWTRSNAPQSAAGPVIEAELIDPDALSASMRRVLSERPEPLKAVEPVAEPVPEPEPEPEPKPEPIESTPPPQPLPEPAPEQSPTPPQPQPQERVPEPDKREQERVSKQALADKEAKEREQEERRRQEQIELAAEKQRLAEAERKQQETEMERQRQQQKLDEIRRRRAETAREIEQAEQKLARIKTAQDAASAPAPASASPPPGNEGVDEGLVAKYKAAISAAIERNWTKPDNIQPGLQCRITIRQLPGGNVIDAKVAPDCPYDELGRRSIETAVLKAQPLPYAGFEDVFNRTLLLNFEPER